MKTHYAREIREAILLARRHSDTPAWLLISYPNSLYDRAYTRTRARMFRDSPLTDEETQSDA